MFLADFQDYFSDRIFAEMRGVSDANGRSPFWESLGRRFFNMEFSDADYLTGIGRKSFIAELMPKYPIYLPLLSPAAREVVGRVHESTRPALRMLEEEGFNYSGLVDIFDAGPVVEGFVHNIRAVRDSYKRHVLVSRQDIPRDVPPGQLVMVSNRSFRDFRVTTVPASCVKADTISLPAHIAEGLKVSSGDVVRIAVATGQECYFTDDQQEARMSLKMTGEHLIDGQWQAGQGEALVSLQPVTGEQVWAGRHATGAEVDAAIAAGRRAFRNWRRTPRDQRQALLERYAQGAGSP